MRIQAMGRLSVLICVAAVLETVPLPAAVKLPHVFSDNMVLQREKPVPVWGWADPGEKITVTFGGQSQTAVADAKGDWMVKLPAMPANANGQDLTVAGTNSIVLHDVLVGEVWLCSGQSNIRAPVASSLNAQQEIAAADHPQIRLFNAALVGAAAPQTDNGSSWEVCSPQTVPNFSAMGYYFGRDLQPALKVPVGLIESSWGGTSIEVWISQPAIQADPDYPAIMDQYQTLMAAYQKHLAAKHPVTPADIQALDYGHPPTHFSLTGATAPNSANGPESPPHKASVLYNGMIAPLAPFALRGVVWNQGQGNASHPEQYRALLGALIGDWRRAWQADDLPFLVVQISSWSPPPSWVPNGFASIREAQLQTSETVPHTGLVVTVDLGEQHNPHYKNKQVAGARIALAARGLVYGEPLAYSGPIYDHMQKSGNAIRIFFKPPDDGLKTLDGADLKTFVIAGADQKFVPAQAVIDGSTVVVSAPGVADPAAVRYAWADYVGGCNLCNEDFLPASPFRTDDWPVHVGK